MKNGKKIEVKYYNKFLYFYVVGAELTNCVGSSLCGWINNESESLRSKCRESVDRGFTRVELRFEDVQL